MTKALAMWNAVPSMGATHGNAAGDHSQANGTSKRLHNNCTPLVVTPSLTVAPRPAATFAAHANS